jgi:DNA repair exonuclease SbcCD ATPase subunit
MNELMERNPNIIASEIEAIKNQTKIIVLSASMEIGKRLKEVKAMLPHGTWGTWLQDNVDYSERTAQNLMALHDTYSGMSPAQIEGIGYSQAVALLGIESEILTEAIENNDIPAMSTQEVEELAKQLREEQKARAGIQLELDILKGADQRAKDAETAKTEAEKAAAKEKQDRIKAENEAKRLRQELEDLDKEPDVPVEVIVEKVPDAVQKELEDLRKIAAKAPSAPVIKFRQIYEDFQMVTSRAVACIDEIEKENPETAAKYRGALRTACEGIITKLDGGAV